MIGSIDNIMNKNDIFPSNYFLEEGKSFVVIYYLFIFCF